MKGEVEVNQEWWHLLNNLSSFGMKKGDKKRKGNSIIDERGKEIVRWTK